ncbi:MAG TPA: hypothetical protein DCZ93_12720 [Elusimicrobia bacterium]|nr:hypothetical protein [Elusimicrobiota bacterium]
MEDDTERTKLEHNIWKAYIQSIITNAAFFVPVIVLFWQENGLDFTRIMVLQTLYSIVVVLLEVPTGYFADIFSRRAALTVASSFLAAGMLIYAAGNNFFEFLIAETVWAIGVSLISGCDAALLYDTLAGLDRKTEYKKIIGQAMFYGYISTAVASIAGGIIGHYSFRWTFIIMIPFLVLLIPVSLSIKEPKRERAAQEKAHFTKMLNITANVFKQNTRLKWLIIYSAIILGFNQTALWLYQPYMKLSGLDVYYFGIVFASFQGIAALSSKYAHKIERRLGEKNSILLLAVLVAGSLLLMANFIFLFSFLFVFLQQFVRGFGRVVVSDYVNKETSSDIRATVLSVNNLGARAVYAIAIPFIGYAADKYSITAALNLSGILALIFGAAILAVMRKAEAARAAE